MRSPDLSRWSIGVVSAWLAAAAVAGCGASAPTSSGSGGTSSGGATASGGSTGSGGATATGGVTASGGTTGSGGVRATGGVASTGGATATGGASASGGAFASGGATSTGGDSATGGASASGGVFATGGANPTGGAKGGSSGAGGASSGSAGKGGASGAAGNSGAGGAADMCPAASTMSGGTKICSNQKGNVSGGGGYSYELWTSDSNMGCMTVFSGGAFSANWNNADDYLARVGLGFDMTKTPAQIGTLSADFAETKTGGDGLVYVGIYGWTDAPLREFYILDDWGSTMPGGTSSDGTPRDHVGTITVDGGTYEVWKKTRTNKPAITGDNKTFDQYFSIRQTARQCGHISISEHFTKWQGLGLQLGKLFEAKVLVEAQMSTGTVTFSKASVTVK